eukprot:SAG25_NODE_601_length_6632_cov_6.861319_4_plen_85_part_00
MSRLGCSLPANASGFDPRRASISSRFGQVAALRTVRGWLSAGRGDDRADDGGDELPAGTRPAYDLQVGVLADRWHTLMRPCTQN